MAEEPTTTIEFPEELKTRAREFWAKAAEVAYTQNYDYAIELFLDGLNFWPEAIEEGHKKLREVALRRQQAGGKKSGFGDGSKYRKGLGKTGKDHMLKAEYFLSKDPANLSHMADMLKGALDANFKETGLWIGNLLFDYNRASDKPAFQTYVFLKDALIKLESFPKALQCCQLALQIKRDPALDDQMRDLSAQSTMQQGKYDQDGDFRDSIKDKDAQDLLHNQKLTIRSSDMQSGVIQAARMEFQADPKVPAKINKLVDALIQSEDADQENEAIEILEKAYQEMEQFRFRQRISEIRIRQLNRMARNLQAQCKKEPHHEGLRQQYHEIRGMVLQEEIEHYRLCVENYPTDMKMRFEYGRRLMTAKRYDEAIPMFQEARSDPRYKIAALDMIGQCFFFKEWYPDAIETFTQALEGLDVGQDTQSKELRYHLGRAYEADGKVEDALGCYRKVAQIDFNYLDVRTRVDALRKQQDPPARGTGEPPPAGKG